MPRAKNGRAWKPIDRNVPRETQIQVKTVQGIVCLGLVPKKAKLIKPDRYFRDGKRIAAKRLDLATARIGDVRAVAWR